MEERGGSSNRNENALELLYICELGRGLQCCFTWEGMFWSGFACMIDMME